MSDNQRRSIAFLVPTLPPFIDGVGDYTTRLCEHSSFLSHSLFLAAKGAEESLSMSPSQAILPLPCDGRQLIKLLADCDIKIVILQYSSFGFDARGCPLWLLNALRQWRYRNPSSTLVVMAHELWFTPALLSPNHLLQVFHRRKLIKLFRYCDHIFTSTPGYADTLRKLIAYVSISALPIGSNILPTPGGSSVKRNANAWVLFGRQSSRIRALQAFSKWIPLLFEAGLLHSLEIVGSVDSADLLQLEKTKLAALLPHSKSYHHGSLTAPDVSDVLSSSTYGLFAQPLASCLKSGIFMAYAAHKLAVVVPESLTSSCKPASIVLAAHDLVNTSNPSAVAAKAACDLFVWYQANASWDSISRAYEDVLANHRLQTLNADPRGPSPNLSTTPISSPE
jgi:hypothetical protein